LPKILDMPLLSWEGQPLNVNEIGDVAVTYSSIFRHEIGGCNISAPEKPRVRLTASDLFCLGDKDDAAVSAGVSMGPAPVRASPLASPLASSAVSTHGDQ